jgi:murein DD-endopeptidase MepM/ murein hydrolase activator NlpD
MRKKHFAGRQVFAVALLAAVLAAVPAGPAGASYRQRQQELQTLINQKEARLHRLNHRAAGLMGRIQDTDYRLFVIQRRIDILEGKLANARYQLSLIEVHLDQVSAALRGKNAELQSTLADLADQTGILNKRVTDIYISAPTNVTTAAQVANDFSDVMAANEYAGSIVRADQGLLTQIEQTKAKIETQRAAIAKQQAVLQADHNAAQAQAQRVLNIQRQQATVRAEQKRQWRHQQHLLHVVNQARNAYVAAIRALQAESASIEALLHGWQRGQRVVQGFGGYLKWPVSGPITSPFGWRIHPIYHYRSFHTGIDIGVGSGTIVKSARRGRVLYTGYQGAYGLIVIIDHGGSLATVYAHLSRVFVSPGESVGTLRAIAASGNTGWSTGPHLHFEVRSQGSPVNPVRWL